MKPQTDGFDIRRAHDVRKLKTCGVCGKLGKHGDGMVKVSPAAAKRAQYAHVPCYIQYHNRFGRGEGVRALARIEPAEINRIRPLMDLTEAQYRLLCRVLGE